MAKHTIRDEMRVELYVLECGYDRKLPPRYDHVRYLRRTLPEEVLEEEYSRARYHELTRMGN